MTLVSRSCCGIDAPARGTGYSRWLQATFISLLVFFFPQKGWIQPYAWLFKPKGAQTWSFPSSSTHQNTAAAFEEQIHRWRGSAPGFPITSPSLAIS